MKGSEKVIVNSMDIIVECPHCFSDNEGWGGDPRGEETTCEVCGKKFEVPDDVHITIQ